MPRYSFCMVNWNGGATFSRSVGSALAEAEGLDAELVIVDNGSDDGSIESLPADPRIRVLRNGGNRYFARATNRSVTAARGECLIILNNDIVFPRGSLGPYLAALERHPDDVICPRLVNPDGSVQSSIRYVLTPAMLLNSMVGLSRRRRLTWAPKDFDYDTEQAVEQPLFSLLFMARKTFYRVGAMDEGFPLFFNDVDWFKRAKDIGVRTVYVPGPPVIHLHGFSTRRRPFRLVSMSSRSMARYIGKHHPAALAPLLPMIAVSWAARLVMAVRKK